MSRSIEIPLLNDRRQAAMATGEIARILAGKGQMDEVLSLHEQILVVLDDLGDRRERAVALGDIARIKVSKGDVELGPNRHGKTGFSESF